jgi:serine phosphatase RsbU (regulator of sigma subunit)
VDGIATTSGLDDLIKDGADVHTTIFDFGEAVIKRTAKGDLSILSITGVYSRALGKEIERLGIQWRGNLGIEFKEIKVNPAMRKKFDSSIVGVLKTIRERYRSKNRLLILCTPPSELLDLLKLTGVHTGYQIIEDPASFLLKSGVNPPADAPAAKEGAPQRSGAIQKRILQLNQSLNRTVSLEKGLDSAAKCVKRFLPQAPPEAEGYRFAFSYKSSEKVGGDFFDFIPLGGDALGLLIGDVSGHGLDAALLMGITKKVIRIRAASAKVPTPHQVLCQANADLVSDFNRYTFATALYGILDLPTGYFTFARAGHEVPLLFGPERPPVAMESKGIPLAIDTGKNFSHILEERTIQIQKGEFLLLSTDGLVECWNTRGASYTRERLSYALGRVERGSTADAFLEGLLEGITEFTGGRPQEDDMTAILVQRLA